MTDCKALETPPATLAPALLRPEEESRLLLVTPRGDERLYEGRVHHTFTLEQAVARAVGGTTIRLLPGKYYRGTALVGKRGEEKAPIVIEGTCDAAGRPLAEICGTNAAGAIYPDLPAWEDYAFLKLRNCEHVIVRHLRVESCWPSFLYAQATRHLTVEDVSGRDGTYLIFLRGPGSSDLTVRGCSWIQDPTGTLWNAVDWEQSHHGAYAYYNGALVGGRDFERNALIEHNRVESAFNGIRFETSSTDRREIQGRFNVNFRIRHNGFRNIRDNAVEPEDTLLNWHVYGNAFHNVHACFSLHDLHGGYLYLYANRLWFDARGGADFQDNRGGKVYKLRHDGPLPEHPFHVFNNSLFIRSYLIKKGRARHFQHRGNAIQLCRPGEHPDCLCPERDGLLKDFPIDRLKEPLPWDPSVRFDGDACNVAFGSLLTGKGQEAAGLVAPDLGFVDAPAGDFSLRPESPLRGAGGLFVLERGRDLPPNASSWRNWEGEGRPHIGALQEAGLTQGPPFTAIPEGFCTAG